MVEQNEIIPKRRRKVRISYVLMVLLLVIAVGFVIFRFRAKSNLQSKIDAIRAAGYPVTGEELNAWYTIPEFSENAANTIIEAFSHYYEWDKQYLKDLPVMGEAEFAGARRGYGRRDESGCRRVSWR